MSSSQLPTADCRNEWESSWSSLDDNMVQLYTPGETHNIHQFWQRCYFEDLWYSMGPNAVNASYLELGAGRGTTSMYLSSKGAKVTMLDLAPAGFQVATKNFEREKLPVPTFVLADAKNTGLPAESFDCVFSIGLLEHFEDPAPVLEETVRLLRPGGVNFSVIMPERPRSVRFLTLALLRPWALPRELGAWGAHDVFKSDAAEGQPTVRPDSNVLRTTLSRPDYLRMCASLPVTDITCVPYNPYHPIHRYAEWEEKVTLPAYRLHRAMHKRFADDKRMVTAAGVALCDLLVFRKRD